MVAVCFITTMAQPAPWLDVPFVAQPENGCGAAVISMTLQYWAGHGAHVAAEASEVSAIQEKLFSPSDQGIRASAMAQYFTAHGFRALSFLGDSKDVQEHISKGRPLIVALRESKNTRLLHYVVVVGVDPQENVVLVNDPARRKLLKVDEKEFQQAWARAENWTLLVVPTT
jgi:ABC-type bacteriocin/lantibiotic exporter with double-glycine peptidase domain